MIFSLLLHHIQTQHHVVHQHVHRVCPGGAGGHVYRGFVPPGGLGTGFDTRHAEALLVVHREADGGIARQLVLDM